MESMVDCALVSSVDLTAECIQVFDLSTGANIRSYRGTCVGPKTLATVGPGILISGQKDKSQLQSWALNQTDQFQKRFLVPGKVKVLAVSPTGSKWCALGIGENLYVYSLLYGKLIGVISKHYQEVTCIQFTQCGCYFASAACDGFIYLWSKASLVDALHKSDQPQVQPHYVLGQHSDKVTGMCITSAGIRGQLMTCSLDHSAKIFDLITGRLMNNVILPSGLLSIATNSLGSQVFLGEAKGKIWGLNLLPHHPTCDIQVKDSGIDCHEKGVTCLSLSVAGNILISGGEEGEVKMWSIVLSNKSYGATSLSLAFQRTLHMGRGAITNILLMKVNREILNAVELPYSFEIPAFNTENKEGILEASVNVPIKRQHKKTDQKQHLKLAASLLSGSAPKVKKHTMKNNNNTSESVDQVKLKRINKEMYEFCLKNIIGE